MSDAIDVARRIFINDEGELRSGWRALAFAFLLIITLTLVSTIVAGFGALIPPFGYYLFEPKEAEATSPRALVFYNLNEIVTLASALIASGLSARLLEGRSFASVGFKLHRGWWRDFALGTLIGAVSLALAVAINGAAGGLVFSIQTTDGAAVGRNLAILFFFFLMAAAVEEVIFRGFAFQTFIHNIGPVPAVAITALLFGLAHIPNTANISSSTKAVAIFNTVLAGVWLGIAYLMTRSLWLATALHYSWNLTMAFVFGLPVSGIVTFDRLAWLHTNIASPQWLSGGSYGPEGGAAATVALIISTLIIWKGSFFSPSEEMLNEIKHGKRIQQSLSIRPRDENQTPERDTLR
ncbi:MAG TPA: CPBP family intramembrane glutamic endopeptidase [Blastocatellia bacterium]|nr:CPBP family intramembrane glutamic endopeptidase [Blastocatellia bacterium]